MRKNEKEYALHIIDWIEKLGVPDVEVIKVAFSKAKIFWINSEYQDFEAVNEQLWSWIDSNGGPRFSDNSDVTKARMVMCVTSDNVLEVQDKGFFEDLLVSLGYSYKEAYADT